MLKKTVAAVTSLSFLFSTLSPGFALAGEFEVFSKTYVRSTGSPQAVTDGYGILNPNSDYKLRVLNGGLEDSQYELVSSATLKVNGTQVLGPSNFNQNVSALEVPVTSQSVNTIEVTVTGKPNGALVTQIYGIDDALPTIQITSPQDGASFNTNTTLVQISAADALAGLDPATFKVLVNGIDQTSSFSALLTSLSSTSSGTIILAPGSNTIQAEVKDLAGNLAQVSITVTFISNPVNLPPDPATVAPPLDKTVATNNFSATEFIYTGANPIQTGVAPGTIDFVRSALLRGKVLDKNNAPLSGVAISIADHPEFGSTLSRLDGMFDMVVNGGGPLTVQYAKTSYLTVHRQSDATWQEYAWMPDVVMIPLDTQVTPVSQSPQIQVAQGNTVADIDGTRTATLLFPPSTTATLVMPDNSTIPLTSFNVRATEYTVGSNGKASMPAELPSSSGYTYAVEYSLDEALQAGAKKVEFNQPVISYTENFIGFPVGTPVPAGYYDADHKCWIPSDNGRVIKILAINAGTADLDIDGSNASASPAALAGLGITPEEQQTLAQRYAVGQSLWRVPIPHFSPWDLNWPFGPPVSAILPRMPIPLFPGNFNQLGMPCIVGGSQIQCENQILGEEMPVIGTPYLLKYQSDRVPGFKANDSLRIALTPASIPPTLKRVDLTISIAGRIFNETFAPAPDLSYEFTWDRQDAFGRTLQGQQTVEIKIGYAYDMIYQTPSNTAQSFALLSGTVLGGNLGRSGNEVIFYETKLETLGVWDARQEGLGGWTLSQHHTYDPTGKIIHLGSGGQRNSENLNLSIKKIAGGASGVTPDHVNGYEAFAADVGFVQAVKAASDGTLYYIGPNNAPNNTGPYPHLFRIRNGISKKILLQGEPLLNHIDLEVDGAGNIYILQFLDSGNNLAGIKKISNYNESDFTYSVEVIAGGGTVRADGVPATQNKFDLLYSMAMDKECNIYLSERADPQGGTAGLIRQIMPNGIIQTIAGNGIEGFSGDGGPATQASVGVGDLAVGPDGSVYLADTTNHRVRRIGRDGIITTVAGNGAPSGDAGDGGPATSAQLPDPTAIAVSREGVIYVMSNRLVRIGPDGILTTEPRFSGSNGLEFTLANLEMDFSPNGDLFIAGGNTFQGFKIHALLGPIPGFLSTDVLIPSEDGSQIYVFDKTGRHLRTIDALTQGVLYSFGYDAAGKLEKVMDESGNETLLLRDGSGNLTGIQSPYGQDTSLDLDLNGFLKKITDPAGRVWEYAYDSAGIMQSFIDPNLKLYSFTFNNLGLLTKDTDPVGGFQELSRTTLAQGGYEVSRKTALNRESKYKFESLVLGYRRTLTSPDGTVQTGDFNTDKLFASDSITTGADGTISSTIFESDPRWGLLAKYPANQVTTTPGGLSATIISNKLVANPGASGIPFNIISQTETTKVNGNQYQRVYDVASKTFTNTTPLSRQSLEIIDSQGRTTHQEVTGLDPVDFTYDLRGRLAQISQGTGVSERDTAFAYNSAGFLQTVTDAENRAVSFEYDLAGRVTKQTLPGARDILYSYDANGNVTSITPPGRPAHVFQYTDVNLQSEYNPPDVGLPLDKTVYSFNLDKDLTLITRPNGQTVAFNYELSGRLDNVTIPTGVIDYTYTPTTGQVSSVSFPSGDTCSYLYDGSLLKKETWAGPVAGFVSYVYDNEFRLTSQNISGIIAIPFGYDNDSLLTGAGSLTLARNPQNGLLTGTTLGNLTDSFIYNTFAEVQSYTANYSNTPVYQTSFLRDRLGRITQKTETINSTTAVYDYAYDLEGRLQEVKKDNIVTQTYTYDSNGNRAPGTYDNQDRLTAYGANTYTYNANGDLQSKTTGSAVTAYTYDVLGNLTNVVLPDLTQISYVIDGQNRRVGKKINDSLNQGFLYQNSLSPVAELDSANNIVSVFVYGSKANVPDYMIKNSNTYRIVSDHLGSPRLIIDTATGTVAQQIDYDEFGNVTNDTNPGFQPFGFAGGLYDPQTKLTRFGARDYDAETGRWTSKDPIRFNGKDANLYGYVLQDPINLRDVIGLWSVSISGYEGWGGGVIFGKNPNGGSFITIRGGYGVGGGLSYNPQGTSPGWDPCEEHMPVAMDLGVYAEAAVADGPIYGGLNANAGWRSDNGLYATPGQPEWGIAPSVKGVRAEVSTGIEVTFR